jgi:hypothetical protein
MKNYQFNLIFGTLLSIHSYLVELGWITTFASVVALGYIITGLIQYSKDE